MIDPERNSKNDGDDSYEHSLFEMVNSPNGNGSSLWSSNSWDLISINVLNDVSDFHCLKARINLFLQDHPTIIHQIQKHFSNELIEHILKRSFRVQFTVNDSANTHLLYQRFFVEQDRNIRLIFDYFFDDIRLLILTGKFENLPWSIRQAIIRLPKSVLLQLTMTWLNIKGAETLTRMLYENLLQPVPKEESILSFLFDEKSVSLFLMIYLILLFIINIPMIGIMINISSPIVFIGLIIFYIFNYLNKSNR